MAPAFEWFVSLWIALKCFFSFSWTRVPQRKPISGQVAPHVDTPVPQAIPGEFILQNETVAYDELDEDMAAISSEGVQLEYPISEKASLGDIDTLNDADISSGNPSILVENLGILSGSLDENDSQDISSIMNGASQDSSCGSLSTDVSDLEGLNDSLVEDILTALDSEVDISDSFYADASDDFLSCNPFSSFTGTPSWSNEGDDVNIADADSSWKHEVATAMHAFKSCKADSDDIFWLFPESKLRLTFGSARRISQRKQLQEIQEWRNDLGDECESDLEPCTDADYSIVTAFRFP